MSQIDRDRAVNQQIDQLQREIYEKSQELAELRQQAAWPPVEDYELQSETGSVRLSELFGDNDDLILVQHMGRQCPYCCLWADEYNGVLNHLQERAAFAVCSPDKPKVQQRLKEERGWDFQMVSSYESSIKRDLNFETDEGQLPGVTTFHKKPNGAILHVASAPFGPRDSFCSVWNFFDLLAGGANGWEPPAVS